MNIKVAGADRVGAHCRHSSARGVPTYSPQNADGWKVEMGNVGRAYFDWRYKGLGVQLPPPVTATAAPVPVKQAAISISPAIGDTTTGITVTGSNFPARATVSISIRMWWQGIPIS